VRRDIASAVEKPAVLGMSTLAACYQPILFLITEFAVGSVQDAACWCGSISFSMATHMTFVVNAVFSKLYAQRWPAVHEAMRHVGENDWVASYIEMLYGKTRCILEVFHREKKRGFAMSAMPAWVCYSLKENAYQATYLSASVVPPEWIPAKEERRLRYLPTSARSVLQPRRSGPGGSGTTEAAYPFRVLRGVQGLVLGGGVEVQWKMQENSPFGWWYGDLEHLQLQPDGTTAIASVTFRHFPRNSRWYRMKLVFGDSTIRPCDFGGYTGGVRPTTRVEQAMWLSFLP